MLAIPYLLLVTVTSLFLHYYSGDGIFGRSRFAVIEKAPIKTPEGARQKAANKPGLALSKITGLSFLYSFSLFRFDFKQNLRTWPVLSNGRERSPPSF